MLFCKSSTVKVGTIALICTASCVVATTASFCFSSCFVHPQASGPRPELQARPCEKEFSGDNPRPWLNSPPLLAATPHQAGNDKAPGALSSPREKVHRIRGEVFSPAWHTPTVVSTVSYR